jgi:hypothetical protein
VLRAVPGHEALRVLGGVRRLGLPGLHVAQVLRGDLKAEAAKAFDPD